MHLILLSGGSGKRLWPLSNDVRSKQFLKLLDGPDGTKESMVQRVRRQLEEVGGWDSITIAAGAAQRDQIELQMGTKVNLVIEPERRDTFPAIALACSFLYNQKRVRKDETIAILPVDVYADNEFFEQIKNIENELKNLDGEGLVLVGAAPLFPSEKYGYIVVKEGTNEVAAFKEKPSALFAKTLMDQGALWNCGVFGLKLGYVLDILQNKFGIAECDFQEMVNAFGSMKKTSFDYEIVEKEKRIRVLRYMGIWKDLGTWETLTEEIRNQCTGNAVIGTPCLNTHVINELNLPVVAMGMQDAVVVASHDGILVANKGQTYGLKDVSEAFQNRPMYEERRWGAYTVLDRVGDGQIASLTKKIVLEKGRQISYQFHRHRKEIWTILSGKGILYLDGEKKEIGQGEVVEIEKEMKHGLKAIAQIEMIEVQLGSSLIEEDIVRLEYDWR